MIGCNLGYKKFPINTHLQRRIVFTFLTLTICCHRLFAAGPVMHLWVAERFCSICNLDEAAVQSLMIGSEFSDIRYISDLSRESTHPTILKIENVSIDASNFFEVGMNLHSWTDIVREEAINPAVYDAIAPYANGKAAALLKFIEDEVLAELYDGTQWLHYFNTILPEELDFTDEATVSEWHEMIRFSLTMRPSWLLWLQSYRGPQIRPFL